MALPTRLMRFGAGFGRGMWLASLLIPLSCLGQSRRVQRDGGWEHAVEMRGNLESRPLNERTRERYEDVLNAFRTLYHKSPTAAKAPAAVEAVAELLAEKGRTSGDPKALRSAIGQYEFLRQQYPRSPQFAGALLAEAEICRTDLHDATCAQEKLRAVIDAQPSSSLAEQAALELKDLKAGRVAAVTASVVTAPATEASPANADVTAAPVTHGQAAGRMVTITGMRHWSNATSTRIAIDLGGKVEYEAARVPNPDRIFFDLHGARLAAQMHGRQVEVIEDGFLKRIRAAQFQADVTRVVLDVTDVTEYSAFLLPNPWRLIIDIHGAKVPAASRSLASIPSDIGMGDLARLGNEPEKVPATAGPTSGPVSAQVPVGPITTGDAIGTTGGSGAAGTKVRRKKAASTAPLPDPAALPHAADPDSDGQRSLVRALGLKVGRIAIDPGHGGHDSGTLGPGGIEEKDVVLDVALRVGKLLHERLGAEIVYTRSDDTFVPLETRTAIANKAQADLFLSIHANSSSEPEARGVEAYYLNFTSDPNALEVAARENAVSNQSVHQLSDLVRKITLKDKIEESREFAADVDAGLYAGLRKDNAGLKDRGAKKAPFVVLIGAQMPSVLAEISFLTNPEDADELRQGAYRQRIAEALAAGVERYLRGLSGLRPVEKTAKATKSAARTVARAGDEPAGN